MTTRRSFMLTSGAALLAGLAYRTTMAAPAAAWEVTHTDAEWRAQLSAAQYEVLRKHGTERPFSSPLYKEHRAGKFFCAGCQNPLFTSKNKFDSGTGWPSFTRPVLDDNVGSREDNAHGMRRIEVVCKTCGGHLGHVFPDGPGPTGLRYCINSCSLQHSETSAK